MRRITDRLVFRLIVSHILVLVIAVGVTALLSRSLAGSFFEDHLRDMGQDQMMGGMSSVMSDELSRGFDDSFNRALTIAMIVSGIAAVGASGFAATRLVRPIERVRRATRRLASGFYSERVPVPVETELAALAHDVNSLGAALEEVEERRVRLVAEVAHELRTPLTTIQGYMEALLDGVLQPGDEIYAATAREAARLQRVAMDLSLLSRAEENRLDLNVGPLDLEVVAAEAASRLRPQFDGNGVDLIISPGENLRIQGDSDRLAQVFTNVVGNALTHTSRGGTVQVTSSRIGVLGQIRVTDTGRGIPQDQLELIFERFYRIDREAPGGTGIGLTIARRIVRLHGGNISAESAGEGRGSTFLIAVPLDSADGRPIRDES
ncbi:HAMP domain-containing histidine kinase [bacterium]|nr:HAMP domain-containing histidine kinase [bacterium]